MATAADIGPAVPVTAVDDDELARIKGDVRMVDVLARSVLGFERPIKHRAEVGCGRYVLNIDPDAVRRLVSRTRRQPGTHHEATAIVRAGIDPLLPPTSKERIVGEGWVRQCRA